MGSDAIEEARRIREEAARLRAEWKSVLAATIAARRKRRDAGDRLNCVAAPVPAADTHTRGDAKDIRVGENGDAAELQKTLDGK